MIFLLWVMKFDIIEKKFWSKKFEIMEHRWSKIMYILKVEIFISK